MRTRFTIEDLRKSPVFELNKHLFEIAPKEKRKSKYGAKKTVVNGIVFDSKKEAERYKSLSFLLKVGAIGFLELQVPFELNPGGLFSLKYVADFVYVDSKTGEKIVEDVKGMLTAVYKKKKKLMLKIHKIKIHEV